MERSMVYEGFVKSEGVYEGRGDAGEYLTGDDEVDDDDDSKVNDDNVRETSVQEW